MKAVTVGKHLVAMQGSGDIEPVMVEFGEEANAERVAVICLLDERKADILTLIVPRWEAIDFGGREVVYVLVANDASEATVQTFNDLVTSGRTVVNAMDIEGVNGRVPDIEHMHDPQGSMRYFNTIFMHKLAELREFGRCLALAVQDLKDPATGEPIGGPPADLFYWLDMDVAHEPDGFLKLLAVLRGNTGPCRPRAVVGLYPERFGGNHISPMSGAGNTPHKDYGQFVKGAGFGCCLMERETLEAVGFSGYARWRAQRRWQQEVGIKVAPPYGEDFFWFDVLKRWCGVMPWEESSVRCDHYHADGSFFRHEDTGDELGLLHAVYHEETVIPGTRKKVRNAGPGPAKWPSCRVSIPAGEMRDVSPDVWDKLKEKYGPQVEDLPYAWPAGSSATTPIPDDGTYPTFESIAASVQRLYGPRDGWCHPDEARALYELSKKAIPLGPVAEIGVNRGLSTCFEAASGNTVYAFDPYEVDTWEPTAEWPQHPSGEKAWEFAERRWEALGLRNIVLTQKASPGAGGYLPPDAVPLGLVFIDGAHTYEACKADLIAWCPLIAPGGYLCVHDYVAMGDSHSEGVAPACHDVLDMRFWKGPQIIHGMAILQRRVAA